MKFSITYIATALITASTVAAHGYVETVTVGSTSYTGYLPYSDPYYNPPNQRIIRAVPGMYEIEGNLNLTTDQYP